MTADAVGGVWTYALDLAKGLARHGVRTTLAVMGPAPSAAQQEAAREIAGLDLQIGDYKLEWMQDPWPEVDEAGNWLLALCHRVKPDVVHLNGYAHAALPWPVPTMVVCHSDILSWWEGVKGESAPMDDWSEYRRRVRAGLGAAGMIVAPTAAVLDEVERHYGPLPAGRVIHNGRTSSDLYPAKKRKMILSAGRFWDDAKNLQILQQVAPNLDWPVYVAGDLGSGRQPRTQGVNFLGRLCPAAMHAWFSRAAIYAHPAKYEPFGLSVLEAALSGCALVLGDIPSLRELWDGAAMFVPPDDPVALQLALDGLGRRDAVRDELAARAQERAQLYSLSNMVCAYLFAYQDLKQGALLDMDPMLTRSAMAEKVSLR